MQLLSNPKDTLRKMMNLLEMKFPSPIQTKVKLYCSTDSKVPHGTYDKLFFQTKEKYNLNDNLFSLTNPLYIKSIATS